MKSQERSLNTARTSSANSIGKMRDIKKNIKQLMTKLEPRPFNDAIYEAVVV
jgi:hypothetical protein